MILRCAESNLGALSVILRYDLKRVERNERTLHCETQGRFESTLHSLASFYVHLLGIFAQGLPIL